jgi:D-alanyl-D-alanine carboxypeptidase
MPSDSNLKGHGWTLSPAIGQRRACGRVAERLIAALFVAALAFLAVRPAGAAPALLMEADSGAVLYEDHATQPWYPASLTKLMTVYIALKAVREHRIAADAPLLVSARAYAMPPSKMGFRPGMRIPLDAALKILMVKSANDVSVTVAEGIAGSVEAFAAEMNDAAAALGMRQSHFVNPNGLPDPQHYSSARDFGILARALLLTFPEQADLFSIGALDVNGRIIGNHNNLLGRYPGVDGMKTGFTCAAGFNVVASATQGRRKLIAVILGAPTVTLRTIKAAALFDRGFAGIDRPSGPLESLPLEAGAPPDRGPAICHNRGPAIAAFSAENERLIAPLEAASSQPFASPQGVALYDSSALSRVTAMATRITLVPAPSFEPVPIRIAGYAGRDAETPPDDVSAFAPSGAAAKRGPLAPAADALPLKGRSKAALRARALEARAAKVRALHAEALEARASLAHARHQARTQVVSEEGDAKAAAPPSGKGKAAHLHGGAGPAKVPAHGKKQAAHAPPAAKNAKPAHPGGKKAAAR